MIGKSASSWNVIARLSVVTLMFLVAAALVWGTQTDQRREIAAGNLESREVAFVNSPLFQNVRDQPPVVARKPNSPVTAVVVSEKQPEAVEFVKHTPPDAMRERLLKRLHDEAMAHFLSDPRNGYSRMPVTYERMIREWKLPEFATGELGTAREIPFEDDLKRIHAGSLKDFNEPNVAPKKPRTFTTIIDFKKFERKKFDAKKVWEAKSIDLIGLVKHRDPIAYVSEKLPDMKKLDKVPTRQLDDFEASGLSTLYSGRDYYARSHKDIIRLLGAVRARKNCLSCHTTKKEGDLLGAFSYTIREAKYQSKVRGLRNFGPRGIKNSPKEKQVTAPKK